MCVWGLFAGVCVTVRPVGAAAGGPEEALTVRFEAALGPGGVTISNSIALTPLGAGGRGGRHHPARCAQSRRRAGGFDPNCNLLLRERISATFACFARSCCFAYNCWPPVHRLIVLQREQLQEERMLLANALPASLLLFTPVFSALFSPLLKTPCCKQLQS